MPERQTGSRASSLLREGRGTRSGPAFVSRWVRRVPSCPLLGQLRGLPVVERAVEVVSRHQIGVRALIDNATLIEYEDHRGVADSAETVSDDQHSFTDDQFSQRQLDGVLAFTVEGAGGLVEDEGNDMMKSWAYAARAASSTS